jgi:3-hydroxyacyl-CoA dehydrogenase/enoyl-CoA hydratase/3-hydroxybutyryl-CoA epimerase/3-hydroxyacyl-CoA dehydrogenase/enoyl-CoA hydratase/3-hydroxybutyryl-CoA epimerase/enoyl-CoA isomerase
MTCPARENVRRLLAWGRAARNERLPPSGVPAIESVGIVGAGMMGRAIAAETLLSRVPVVLCDLAEEILAGAAAAVARRLAEAGSPEPPQAVARRLRTTTDPAGPAECDLVLESIVESLAAKRQLYAQLRPHLKDRAILASNSSTIPIGRLADGAADPARFCGIHFLRPVEQRPLVEIVRGPQTDDRTTAAAAAYVRRLGRTAIVVGDGPGFVVNRLLFPYLGAALELLREGVAAAAIDRAAGDFGMALGPLRLMDEIGLDTALQAGLVLADAFPEQVVRSPLVVSMIKAGRLGKKAGLGFYAYGPAGDAATSGPDEAVREILEPWIVSAPAEAASSPFPPVCEDSAAGGQRGGMQRLHGSPLAYRLVFPMLLEATRILDEGKVADPRDIDLAALLGLGFPADTGGLLYWADSLGAERALRLMRADRGLESRLERTPTLRAWAAAGQRFYD